MKKHILRVSLVLALLLWLVPAAAFADGASYGIWIGSEEVTSTYTSGAGWSYDPSSNTLTLQNFTLNSVFRGMKPGTDDLLENGIRSEGDLNLVLVGENYIDKWVSSDAASLCAIYADANLVISGSGSLTVTGDAGDTGIVICGYSGLTVKNATISCSMSGKNAIYSGGELSLNNCTVTASNVEEGIYAAGALKETGSKVTLTDIAYVGLRAKGAGTLSSGTVSVTMKERDELGVGIWTNGLTAKKAKVTVKMAQVYDTTSQKGRSFAVYSDSAVTVNGGSLTMTSTAATSQAIGLYCQGGKMTLTDTTVKATNGAYGLYGNEILSKGSTVTISKVNCEGVHAKADFTLNGGKMTINTAQGSGLVCAVDAAGKAYVKAGTLTISMKKTVTGTATGKLQGIQGSTGVEISGGTISVSQANGSPYSYGVGSQSGDVTISGGSVDIKTGNSTTHSFAVTTNNGTVTISGGTLTAKAGTASYSIGIHTNKAITIKGGAVTASGGYVALYKLPSLKNYTKVQVKASTKQDGSGLKTVTLSSKNYSSYKYVKITRSSIAAPSISSVTNGADGITVKWKKVSGASGYKVYRKTASGEYKLLKTISGGSTVSYVDTTATNGTTYIYAVKADSNGVTSSYSKTAKIVRLTKVTLKSVTNSASKKLTVKWTKNAKATGYEVRYVLGDTTKTVKVTSASTVSKVLSGLTTGKTYKVSVRAYKTVDGTSYYSDWSTVKSVKVAK